MSTLISYTSLTSLSRGVGASLTRRLAAGLVATPLMLGTVSVTALASAAPARAATVLPLHGTGLWQGAVPTAAGEVFTGAITKISTGGMAFFGVKDDTPTLKLTDPNWDLKVGFRPWVRVKIDGTSFAGQGIVTSRDVIEIPGLTMEAFKALAAGAEAVVSVNDEIFWTLDLDGFKAAMRDALNYYQASYQYSY